MSNYADFSPHGYQIISELGRNREGGRITWLASNVNTGKQVVLKQFCFAQAGSSWSAYDTYQREIEVLRGLNHPGIPSYLGSFATPDGFCMIQKYINAPSLGVQRNFSPEEIKEIAVKALEILVYLQNRTPSVIHRDIKPENILVNEQLEVYLIDFGFARIGSQEVFGSSVFKGTPGFLPPEQMRQPTEASDLYGLGATLICLLTGVKSGEIQNLTTDDDPYLINFRHLLSQLNIGFIQWLEKMVQPRQSNRFANAKTALKALKTLDSRNIIGQPNVEFSTTTLNFQATRWSEKLTQTITINNSVPETHLRGRWKVAPHRHDPPHTPDYHAWISITPAKFSGNYVECYIQVDTSKLMADKLYKRQLFLHTNAYPEIQILNLEVSTAPLPIERRKVPYATLIWLFLICEIASMSMIWFIAVVGLLAVIKAVIGAIGGFVIGAMGGMSIGYIICFPVLVFDFGFDFFEIGLRIATVIGAVLGLGIGAGKGIGVESATGVGIGIGIWIIVVAVTVWWAVKTLREMMWQPWGVKTVREMSTAVLFTLTAGFSVSVGVGFILGFHNPYILLALAGTALPLVTMLLYPPFKHRRLIAKYRKSEQHLIQPEK